MKGTVSGTRPYHHGDLRRALRETAAELLERGGPAALALREIARTAGVSHAAAYRHFADKEALLADLAEAGFLELLAESRAAVAAARGGPLRKLEASGRAYVAFGVRRPHLLQLMFGPAVPDWSVHPGLVAASGQLAALLADIVIEGQARGVIRAGPVGDLTLTAWSLVHGLALLATGRRIPGASVDDAFIQRAARRATRLLVDGLRSRPRAA
jgi:AcrR family transcriptional regulator